MDIKEQIKIQKKWVEIGKATVEGCIKEGQPQEIIDYEMEQLKKDEEILKKCFRNN